MLKLELVMTKMSGVISVAGDKLRAEENVCRRTKVPFVGSMRWSSGVLRRVTRICPLERIARFSIQVPRGNS